MRSVQVLDGHLQLFEKVERSTEGREGVVVQVFENQQLLQFVRFVHSLAAKAR